MSDEHEYRHPLSRHAEAFGFTETEDLFTAVSDERLRALIDDPQTQVLDIHLDANTYGEYLFITLSKQIQGKAFAITFYGLGYHEYREEWVTKQWKWFQTTERATIPLSKQRVHNDIQRRRAEIAPEIEDTVPSERALLFSLLADLTDEDGAWAELNDLDDME